MNTTGKIILITGASQGIGLTMATYLASQGHIVYGTSRNPDNLTKDFTFKLVALDVCDDESTKNAIDSVIEKEGRIDVLINNAGRGMMGAVEDSSVEEAQAVFDTNFFGILLTSRAVLPHMRNQKSGKIINISSIAGLMGLPFRGIYSASKFAVEGLSESMRFELEPLGIWVSVIEPGDVKTDIGESRVISEEAKTDNSAYKAPFDLSQDIANQDVDKGSDPIIIAQTAEKIILAKNPKVRYVAGALAQKLSVPAKNMLPSRTFENIIKKYYKL